MAWSLKKRVILSCSLGWALSVLGAVLIPILEYVIKLKVQDNVIIKEGGPVYEYWLNPPVPIYMQFYMFNITNSKEFLAGGKPSVEQKGPYTYSEKRIKFNIIWNDNGTVTYRQKRVFQFIPEMSAGNKETDMFITPNPVYWALWGGLKWEDPKVREALYLITKLFDAHVLMKRPMKEIVWGYHDPVLNAAKAIDPTWFNTDFVGYFMNKNNTDDGVYTVYTGASDIYKLGIVDKYNGSSYLNFWSTEWANMINGTDGTLGPPYLPKTILLYSFVSDVCRSIGGIYTKTVTSPQGIKLWRFEAPPNYLENVTMNPDNIGYCTPQDHCLPAGVFNVSTCQTVDSFHLHVVLSFPHFLDADPKVIQAVDGLHPNPDQHQPVLDLEPYTGLVLQAAKRLQINLYIEPVENITETYGLKPVIVPAFWLNESAAIDDVNAKKFDSLLFTPLLAVHIVEGVIIGLGVLLLVATVIYGVWKSRQEDSGSEDSDDTNPIVRYDEDNPIQ